MHFNVQPDLWALDGSCVTGWNIALCSRREIPGQWYSCGIWARKNALPGDRKTNVLIFVHHSFWIGLSEGGSWHPDLGYIECPFLKNMTTRQICVSRVWQLEYYKSCSKRRFQSTSPPASDWVANSLAALSTIFEFLGEFLVGWMSQTFSWEPILILQPTSHNFWNNTMSPCFSMYFAFVVFWQNMHINSWSNR